MKKWWSCPHDHMLASSRCACWKTALEVVWLVCEAVKWPGVFFTWLTELSVTQSVVEPKLPCPLKWKPFCKRILTTSIWSGCPKFNLGRSTRHPRLWMSTSFHCFSAEDEGRCSAFLLEACYCSLVKVFSVLDIVFWRVFQLRLCKGFWVLHLGLWRWDQNVSALLPFGCLFPVTFEVCRHKFQEETRGLTFTGDVWQNSCSLDGVSGRSLIVNFHFLKPGVRSTSY